MKQYPLRLSDDLYESVKLIALAYDTSIQKVLIRCVERFVSERVDEVKLGRQIEKSRTAVTEVLRNGGSE